VVTADNVVEQEADEHPRHIVQRCRRWHIADTIENDREVEVPKKRHLKLLVESPLDKWRNSTGHEKEDGAMVQLTVREEMLWSNDSPLWRKN
jgi:hypothetical protein